MSDPTNGKADAAALLRVLEVTRRMALPCELDALLTEVIEAGRAVLGADRGTVFLYDPETQELYSKVATGAEPIRFPISTGIAGQCARTLAVVNVPDCYADERFNPQIDRETGYRSRSLITAPLVGLDEELVGVIQLLNPAKGVFDPADEQIAQILAGQAAVAIQRAKLLEDRLVKLKLENDLAVAREIQMDVLPRVLPQCPGYDLASFIHPADETGGDLYDVVPVAGNGGDSVELDGLILLLADAAGHGIGPAISVTQVRAMLRMGVRLSSGVLDILKHINGQLTEDQRSCRIVTAFLGYLDTTRHQIKYHAPGQGPLLHFRAAERKCIWLNASTVPLGVLDEPVWTEPTPIGLDIGDLMVLLTDGIYEYHGEDGSLFGHERVGQVVDKMRNEPAQRILDELLIAVDQFAGNASQVDDLTALVIKRVS